MKFTKALFTLFILLGCLPCFSQSTSVEGRVIDKKTHEAISDANIRFKGSLTTTRSDSTGNFKIISPVKVNTIVISYLGYQTTEFAIKGGQTNHVNAELSSSNVNLKEVIIKPGKKRKKREIDTTALYIYRQVIDHKDQNRPDNIDSFYFKEYVKMVYSVLNPTQKMVNSKVLRPFKYFFEKPDTDNIGKKFIPLFLQENFLETYYRKNPHKKINILHYEKISGVRNPAFVKLIGYHFEVSDAYENVHIVFQKSFISPFSFGAKGIYNYHVIDTAKIDGRTSYRLNFVGRVREDLCEKGYAWIDSATWGIKFISYGPNEKANLDYIYELLEEQTFQLFEGHWLMVKENQNLEGSVTKDPRKMGLRVDKTTLRKDVSLHTPMPAQVAKAKDDIVDPNAYKGKQSYIDSVRLDTLTVSERLVYHHFDTARTTPAWQGMNILTTLVTTANIKAGPVDFGRLYRVVSRNNVEGWRVRMGVRTNAELSDKLYLGAYAAYGTKDQAWKYGLNARTLLPSKYNRWHAIEAEYITDMVVLGNDNPLISYDNILTLIGGTTLSKVMKFRAFNLYYERDWIKGLSSNITFSDKRFYSVPGVFNFSGTDNTGASVYMPGFNTTEFSGDLRYCKMDNWYEYYTYRSPLQTKTPSITFKYTLGLKNNLFNGDYTYHKFSVQFIERWQLPVIGYSKIMIQGGYILGNSPYPVAYISSSNLGFIRDDLSFQSAAPFEFVADRYLIVWWEHYFDGFFFNRIPGINRLHLREFIQCKALLGDYSSKNASLITLPTDIHVPGPVPFVEVGCGIENILNIFQVGFYWRCTYRNNPNAANFGVKIGIYPGF